MADVRPVTSNSAVAPVIADYAGTTGHDDARDELVAAVRQGLIGGYVLNEADAGTVAVLLSEEDPETAAVTVRFYHALAPDADARLNRLFDVVLPELQKIASRIVSWFQPARSDWVLTHRGFDELERLHMTLDLAQFRARVPLLPDGYIIRPLKPAHVPELVLPRISANAGTLEHQLFPTSRERAEHLLRGYAEGSVTPAVDDAATLTVLHTGTPIGAILVQRPDETTGQLVDIFVAPEHQGQGIGRGLLISALRALKQGGATRANVETRRQLPAYHLLRQLGFVETHREPVRFWLPVMGGQ